MGALIDIVEEIRLRMQAAITANAIGSAHGSVYIGSKTAFMKMNDYPAVGILISGGDGTPTCMRYGTTEDTDLQIGYMVPIIYDNYNTLYNAAAETGPLRELEQIINYLCTNRDTDVPDLQIAGTAYTALKYRWNVQELPEAGLLFMTVSIDVQTAKYERGSL